MNISIDILRVCPFFATLKENELSLIYDKFEKIELNRGDLLFHENSVDDALFILISGKLQIFTTTRGTDTVIAYIRSGEVVGELSLFSNEPRSASAKAVTHSVLLRLKKNDFQSLCALNPQMLWDITAVIAKRSQFNIKNRKKSKSRIFTFISLDESDVINSLISAFKQNDLKKMKINIVDLNELKSSQHNQTVFREAIANDHFALTFLNYNNLSTHENVIHDSDKIIIVMKDSGIIEYKSKVDHLLTLGEVERELVLIHDKKATSYPNTAQYIDLVKASRWFHVSFDSPETTLRILRFITGTAVGLVVSGSGAKGWAAMGVFKAIYEKGVQIDYLGGTSSGALAANLYAISANYNDFKNDLRLYGHPFSIKSITIPYFSFFSCKNETKRFQDANKERKLEDLTIPFFCITTNLSRYREHVWDRGFVWEAMRATVSIPVLYPPYVYHHELHVDGGVINNFPADVMRNKIGENGVIIGIDLGSPGRDTHAYSFPPYLTFSQALKSFLKISKEKLDSIGIIESILRTMIVGSSERHSKCVTEVNLMIKPNIDRYKISDFDKSEELFEEGYQAALKQLNSAPFFN